MRPRRPLLAFAVRLVLVYALLMAAWPIASRAGYAAALRGAGNALFGSPDTRYRPLAPTDGFRDSELLRLDRRTQSVTRFGFSAWFIGWVPTVTVVALVAATPLACSRRLRALGWGLLLVNAIVLLRVAPALVYTAHPFDATPVWPLARTFSAWLLDGPIGGFVFPIVIWALVSFRASDHVLLRERGALPLALNPAASPAQPSAASGPAQAPTRAAPKRV